MTTTITSFPPLAFHKVEPSFSFSSTNYSPKRLRRVFEFLRQSNLSPELTFDDAYETFLDFALPILIDYNHSATMFAPVGWLGKINSWDYSSRLKPSRHLSGSQLRELADCGFSVQSHGYNHRDLTCLDQTELHDELQRSKEELESILGRQVREICYPFGRYNARVEAVCKSLGYERGWSLNPRDCGEFTRGRWGVYGYDTVLSIKAKLTGGALGNIEYAKARLTNQLSRLGKLSFWTKRFPE